MSSQVPDDSRAISRGDHLACLGLGSNVDPVTHLRRAIGRLRRAVAVKAVSAAWQSAAVASDGPDYINAAVLVRTPMSRELLTAQLKDIEEAMGRGRGRPARLTIDIDIVVFDGDILEDDLWSQAYRAVTVGELLPDLCCPATGESLSGAAVRLAGATAIRPRRDILPGPPRNEMVRTLPTDSTRTPT
jgi:2-amino-4-hydroxy-6-hydroxymethyldihydropteridine diphosphokinase